MRGTNRGQTSGNSPQFRKTSASIKSGAKIGIFSRKTKFLPLFYFISGIKNPFLYFCIIDLTNNNILVSDGSPGMPLCYNISLQPINRPGCPLSLDLGAIVRKCRAVYSITYGAGDSSG